jgi:hypothetical protein
MNKIICPKCNAINPDIFDICHNCNTGFNFKVTGTLTSDGTVNSSQKFRTVTKNIYTKEMIGDIINFMYSSRWRIGKDSYREVGYALNRFLHKAEEVGIVEAYDYFNELDNDDSDYPF